METRVAVIGAGVSGLACARVLVAAGIDVAVIEKSRGVGGRAATRRMPWGNFDHGTQFFTARNKTFRFLLARWIEQGLATPWFESTEIASYSGEPPEMLHVGLPGMSTIGHALAQGLDLRLSSEVRSLTATAGGWRITDVEDRALGEFDWVVSSAPGPGTARLMEKASPDLAQLAAQARFSPCWALLARTEAVRLNGHAVWQADDPVIAWIARDGAKPGRAGEPTWVLHANPAWSDAHIDAASDWASREMLAAWTRMGAPAVSISTVHRWHHAMVTTPLDQPYLLDPDARVAACGDWCIAPRLESAFESGLALGQALRGILCGNNSAFPIEAEQET